MRRFVHGVKIYATDVDEEELTAARTASYSDSDSEGLPTELRDRYFDHVGGRWMFAKDLRRSVIFGRRSPQRRAEELETTNEELQSTVEELETTNEELQSTNEELETMNEELQSANEELETVNNELRQRGVDLSRSNVFLTGILRSVPLAVIVLDEQLQVELWNNVAANLWGLRAEEVSRKHFFGLDIGLPVEQLKQPLAGLLRQGDQRFEVQVNAINRRGRQVCLRVQGAGIGSGEHGKGIIILMQETSRSEAVH